MFLFLVFQSFFCIAQTNNAKILVKGIPFSVHTLLAIEEENIDGIQPERKKIDYSFTIVDSFKIVKFKQIIQSIIKRKNIIKDSYDLRLGCYLIENDIITQKYYIDSHQRLVYNNELYKLKKRDLKRIFSHFCKPMFVEKFVKERSFWIYSSCSL